MSVDNAKIFKFQALKFFDYNTWDLIISIKSAGSAVFNFSPELAEQMSGPSLFPIETEVSTISTEGTLNIGEYGSEIMKALLDAQITIPTITAGDVDVPRNIKGSLFDATGSGVISITKSTTASAIKSGFFRVRLLDLTAKTVEVIALSSPDLSPSNYQDYSKLLVETVTLADDSSNDLAMGVSIKTATTLTLTGMAVGDSFIFRTFAAGSEAYTAKLGQLGTKIPKVRVSALSRVMSDGRWFELFGHNCLFPGANFNFGDEFSSNEVTGKLIFDPVLNYVADIAAYKI